ncbi:DUF1203 domain-containing protein [Solimonas sp. C16B3]|uniref:DUF1203 domain-containing protein n=1 Tax=Solimonas marina TaxID=2714601 RepID=A0A969WDC3_9GAMM|nr:DUF1203 domain-containing protein [Solimonas marina]
MRCVRRHTQSPPCPFASPDSILAVSRAVLQPGETALLLNDTHQNADTPYRASHAIFIREGAVKRYDRG